MTEKERQYKRQRERKTAIESGDKHSQTQPAGQPGRTADPETVGPAERVQSGWGS